MFEEAEIHMRLRSWSANVVGRDEVAWTYCQESKGVEILISDDDGEVERFFVCLRDNRMLCMPFSQYKTVCQRLGWSLSSR